MHFKVSRWTKVHIDWTLAILLSVIFRFLGHNEPKMTQRAQRNRANDPPDLDFVVLVVVRCVLRDHASDSLFGLQVGSRQEIQKNAAAFNEYLVFQN